MLLALKQHMAQTADMDRVLAYIDTLPYHQAEVEKADRQLMKKQEEATLVSCRRSRSTARKSSLSTTGSWLPSTRTHSSLGFNSVFFTLWLGVRQDTDSF
mgnify:CR=1 FL=1